jgi:hypothetical protein
MKWNLWLALALLGCGDAAVDDVGLGDDPETDPGLALSLGDCLVKGGNLEVAWAVDNGHGAIEGMTLDGTGRTALAGEDGVVKYWVLSDEAEPELGGAVSNFNPGGMYGAEFQMLAQITAMAYEPGGTLWLGRIDGQVCRLEEDTFEPLFAGFLEGMTVDGIAPLDGNRAIVTSRDAFRYVLLIDLALGQAEFGTELWVVEDVVPGASAAQKLFFGSWYGNPAFEPWDVGLLERGPVWIAESSGTARAAVAPDPATFFVAGEVGAAEAETTGFVQKLVLEDDVLVEGVFHELDSPVRQLLFDPVVGVVMALTDDGRLIGLDAKTGAELFAVELPMSHIAWGAVEGQLVGSGEHGRLVVYTCE